MAQEDMVAENERLKIFNNKMTSNNAQPPVATKSEQQTKNNQGILPPLSPESQIGLDEYLNHLLTVIEGFLLGILQKQNQKYDIHNKEEAKRLLSIFDNEFRTNQSNVSSSSARNNLRNRYDNLMEILANLEAIERLKVKLRITQQEAQKQKIRNNILKLETLTPQAYKNNIVPGGLSWGSFFSFLGRPAATPSPPAGGQSVPPPAVPIPSPPAGGQQGETKQADKQQKLTVQSKEQYLKIFKQLQGMSAQFKLKQKQLKDQYEDLERRNTNKQLSPQKYQQQKTALNRKQQQLKPLRETLEKKQEAFSKLKVPQDWKTIETKQTTNAQQQQKQQQKQALKKQYQSRLTELTTLYNDLQTRNINNQLSPQKYQQQKEILDKKKQQLDKLRQKVK